MANENLTGALRGSLQIIESQDSGQPTDPAETSPLREATPDSIDELLAKVNEAFGQGLPSAVTDDILYSLVLRYRAEALKWEQDEQIKRDKPKTPRANKKSIAEALELDI